MSKLPWILICFFVLLACTSPKPKTANEHQKNTVTNPNGMSEMSILMEEWYASLQNTYTQIKNGKLAPVNPIPTQEVFKAKTSKSNVHGEQFDAFAESFLYNFESVQKATTLEEQSKAFNLSVTSCINCHEQFCHGPLVRIKKLRLPQD